jgi:tol-pal system protein YbgF
MERLSQQVASLEEQVAELRQVQQEQIERTGQLRKTLESLTVEGSGLEESLRKVRGSTEVLSHKLKQLKERQQRLYDDLDQRLRALEKGQGGGEQAGEAADKEEPIPEFDGPRQAYDAAFAHIEEDRHQQAVRYFKHFLEEYPDSELVPNAHYWLGEAHYVRREFEKALVAFNKVLEQFPDSNKAAAALLKVGFSFYELDEMDSARQALNRVVERFPGTSEARLAKRRLDQIPDDGA